MNILSMTFDQVAAEMKSSFNKGAFHAKALYREVFKKGNRAFVNAPEFVASKSLAKKLATTVIIPSFKTTACQYNDGGVIKFATILKDDNIIETVILPKYSRTTVCVSSQVGCAMGCSICLTGKTGFVRNLTVEEIVAQIYITCFEFKVNVDNVVFMGMGEPLDNFDNVLQAVRVLSDQLGFAISQRAIMISTSGLISGIEKLAALNMPNLRFAVSINAADNNLRSQIMPINKKYPLVELKKALLSLPLGKDGVIFVEYVLIANVNDSFEMAIKLVDYLKGLKVRINVIAFNQSDSLPYTSPTPERVKWFCGILSENQLFVSIRQPRGREISAACGQLRACCVG